MCRPSVDSITWVQFWSNESIHDAAVLQILMLHVYVPAYCLVYRATTCLENVENLEKFYRCRGNIRHLSKNQVVVREKTMSEKIAQKLFWKLHRQAFCCHSLGTLLQLFYAVYCLILLPYVLVSNIYIYVLYFSSYSDSWVPVQLKWSGVLRIVREFRSVWRVVTLKIQ